MPSESNKESRKKDREEKRESKQDHKIDKIDAQARKASAVATKRKWLVFLIGAAVAALVFLRKFFGG